MGDMTASHLRYSLDAALFARERLTVAPDELQTKMLGGAVRRGLLNCTRQWGKSTMAAMKALHRACFEPGSLTVVLSPSGRQSAEFLRKASGFARKLGMTPRGDGDNEISLLLPNGARIVGLPGSESTLRGFSAVSLMVLHEAVRVDHTLYKSVNPIVARAL